MDKLNILKKIYNYGETLSSEELNLIVAYLNLSITAINALIDRNNGINEGHSEIRYKNSAQQPEAPETGSDGTTDGWSDTYAFPDTSNGEITWMTICFINGEHVYGSWSTPVCITWGSVRGLVGPKGESGTKGAFKSRVFKRQNQKPDTPLGGTYDSPIPDGWSDGIPSGLAIIWSSVCTFYGNGTSTGWSIPAPESDSTTLDIEFSPNNILPEIPQGNVPFSNHEEEGWYDPNSENFSDAGIMIWRAERKVSNGEYDGEWTVTRIYGEKGNSGGPGPSGGHYEFRYKNYTPTENNPTPVKPEAGTDGTNNGWSATQSTLTEDDIKNGIITWMTQCYLTGTGSYGVWTTPIRITGANGVDGADGDEIEFIYYRNNSGDTPPTPPTTLANDWPRHIVNDVSIGYDTVTINNLTYTWYDNPQGVEESMMYEFVSTRTKSDDTWGPYSTPVVWSKWGEKGTDGDGYEYIYKRFATQQNFTIGDEDINSDNPADWPVDSLDDYTGPSDKGWSDNPIGITLEYKYEYVAIRQQIDGEWGKFKNPTLWSGIPGGNYEYRYNNYTSTENNPSPTKPATGTDGTSGGWSTIQTSLTDTQLKSGIKTWMTQCFKTVEGIYGTWTNPIRITGANGNNGEDGNDGDNGSMIEFIYQRNNSGSTPATPTSVNTDDYIPTGWTDNPTGVASDMKYEFVSTRTKPAGKDQVWGAFSPAVIWSKWGEKGMDGDGYEYIYKHFSSELTWNDDGVDLNNPHNWPALTKIREYYGPDGYTWSDDPVGVDSTNKYEYVSTRHRKDGVWQIFSTPTLWAKYAEAGATVEGPAGKIGPMSYLAGIWNTNTTYTRNDSVNPIVYRDENSNYYYLKENGSSLGEAPEIYTSKWVLAENYNTVFTDIIFVNTFAKLGSFIVNEDWFLSRHGIMYDSNNVEHIIDDNNTWSTYNNNNAYTEFDPAYPQGSKNGTTNFCPYLAMNAATGESYFQKVHIKGEVEATSGTFNGIVNATGGVFNGNVYAELFRAGNELGFNITVNADSIDFNYGSLKQAWFTTKKLEMNTNGEIVDSNNDASLGFYLYMISPKNGNLVTIDFDSLSFSEINNSNVQLIPIHSTSITTVTPGSNGEAIIGSKTIYYKNLNALGESVTTTYYWDSTCTNQITGDLGNNCYVAFTNYDYVIVQENIYQNSIIVSNTALRVVKAYSPAQYISAAGRIVPGGSGSRIYLIKKNNKYYYATVTSSTSITVYNSNVYYEGSASSPLSSMNLATRLTSDTSGVNVFLVNYSGGNTIPTPSGQISLFKVGDSSNPMTKFDITA